MRHLCKQAETLCRAIAPELCGNQLYVVLMGHLPESFGPGVRRLGGLTTPHLCNILQPELEQSGRWRGRGPGFILAPATIASSTKHNRRATRKRAFVAAFFACVIHELAHATDTDCFDEVFAEQPSPEHIAIERNAIAAYAMTAKDCDSALRWHEWSFIRAAMHLTYRARKAGADVYPGTVFEASVYGLSPAYEYASALGDEPERMADCNFAEIEEVSPPRAFADLWRRDLLKLLLPVTSRDDLKQKLSAYDRRRLFIPTQEN